MSPASSRLIWIATAVALAIYFTSSGSYELALASVLLSILDLHIVAAWVLFLAFVTRMPV